MHIWKCKYGKRRAETRKLSHGMWAYGLGLWRWWGPIWKDTRNIACSYSLESKAVYKNIGAKKIKIITEEQEWEVHRPRIWKKKLIKVIDKFGFLYTGTQSRSFLLSTLKSYQFLSRSK